MPRSLFLAVGVLGLVVGPAGAADILVRDRNGLNQAMARVKPGDRVLLAPGEYAGNFYFSEIHGAPRRPIVIAAADSTRPPTFTGPNVGLQLSGCSHVELYDLNFAGISGNSLNIDDGEKMDRPSHRIVIRNVRVRDTRRDGNFDGIKLSGLDDFLLADCTVERWGSGGSGIDMVGCHRGVVSRCTFRDGGSNGVQIKGGSAGVTVRQCRFENPGQRGVNLGGYTNDFLFRPQPAGMPDNARYEAKDLQVEGCTFVGGNAPVAFVNVDGATVRFNTIVRPERYAIRILQERTEPAFVKCRNGVFTDNVVVFRSSNWVTGGVNIGPGTAPESFKFARNLWYCEDSPDRSKPQLPVAETDGVIGKDPLFRDGTTGDFRVKTGSPAARLGAHAWAEFGK